MIIREALESDAERIWTLHTESIRHFCGSTYTQEQIDEWVGFLTVERYAAAMKSLEFVVGEEGGKVQGFCILNLQTGELHAIYLAPTASGRGLGRQLMNWAETMARDHGWKELVLQSTLNAVSFYEKCGFQIEGTTNQPLPSGMPRACVKMRKALR
jgi:GNAT superfamily N-acetyltransferase